MRSLLLFSLVFLSTLLKAQDTLFMKDARVFPGEIIKVTGRTVTILWEVNGSKPELVVLRSKIDRIAGHNFSLLRQKAEEMRTRGNTDTIFLKDGRSISGVLTGQDHHQYYMTHNRLAGYPEIGFSVLKNGVVSIKSKVEPTVISRHTFESASEENRLWRYGFYFTIPNKQNSKYISKIDLGTHLERRFSANSPFSISIMPGFTIASLEYIYNSHDMYFYPVREMHLVFQCPVTVNYFVQKDHGVFLNTGIGFHSSEIRLQKSEYDPIKYRSYAGPRFGLGYALRLRFAGTFRMEYYFEQKLPDQWVNGLRLTFAFGKDQYVQRIKKSID